MYNCRSLSSPLRTSLSASTKLVGVLGGCLTRVIFPKMFSSRHFSEVEKRRKHPSPHLGPVILGTLGRTKLNKSIFTTGLLGNLGLLLCLTTPPIQGGRGQSSQIYLTQELLLGALSSGGVVLWNRIWGKLDEGICRIPFRFEKF